jgi:hypothetical protein
MSGAHNFWIFIHILLFVFWLGADLGVFICGQLVKRSDQSFDQRMLLVKVLSMIDMGPRTSFALMLPVGLQLSVNMHLIPLGTPGLVLCWLFSAVWLAVTWGIPLNEGKPVALSLRKIQTLLLMIVTVVLVPVGAWSMFGEGPVISDWLSFKILVFGLICGLAILIDLTFIPVVAAFTELAEQGSTPEIETKITAGMNRVFAVVWVLYGALLISAYIGVTKSF